MAQVIAHSLRNICVVSVVGFLLWESIKDGCMKSIAKREMKPAFYFRNRWTVMIPVFIVAYGISLDFLQPVFEFLASGIVAFAEYEFREHVVGGFLVGAGSALLIGLAAAAAYFIYRFWRAQLRWGAFLFFVLVLLATTLAVKSVSRAEGKVHAFYGSYGDESRLVTYVARQESVSEVVAEHLVGEWYRQTEEARRQERQNIAATFYFLVVLASVPATWVWVKLYTLMQVYLLRRLHSSEGG